MARGNWILQKFFGILQDDDEFLEDPDLRQAIDAFAKEDLLYSQDDTGDDPVENAKQDIKRTLKYLKLAQQDRRPVLVIEYLQDHASQAAAGERLKLLGFIPYFGPRELDDLPRPPSTPTGLAKDQEF